MNSVASTLNRVTGMEFNNQISVLTPNNWNTWKHDMQVLLIHYGCWQFIIQTKTEKPDEEATYKEKLDLQLRFQLIRWLPQEFQSTVQQIYRWKEEDFRVVKIEAELILEANRLQLMKQDLEKAENAYLSSFTSKKSKTLPGATAAAHGDPNGKNDYQKRKVFQRQVRKTPSTSEKPDVSSDNHSLIPCTEVKWIRNIEKIIPNPRDFQILSEQQEALMVEVTIPNCYKQAIRSRDASKWYDAMDKEINRQTTLSDFMNTPSNCIDKIEIDACLVISDLHPPYQTAHGLREG
ncbi:retrovirus-related Pol polyprotein from transposon TNT 1-94 [Trichonephila clavipes]|nr:retrovirus-related Pol polyprotein from transposon TNT 1-94 [Trichonephila clavipes]